MKYLELIAPCHFGMEAVLKREILDLGYEISKVEDGKVTFLADAAGIPQANVFLRTTERILNAAAKGLLFLFLYVMLDLCWIGAECVFEGIVHESRVDGVVLAWLCLLLVREIEQFERKIRGDGR